MDAVTVNAVTVDRADGYGDNRPAAQPLRRRLFGPHLPPRLAYDQILQPAPGGAGRAAAAAPAQRLAPVQPRLDLARDAIGPPPRDPEPAFIPIDPAAARVGGRLQPVIEAVQRQTLSGIRLLDRSGIVVAGTAGRPGRIDDRRRDI